MACSIASQLPTRTDLPLRDASSGASFREIGRTPLRQNRIGGEIGWNSPSCGDMWAYDVQKNTWTRIEPKYQDAKTKVNFREDIMTGYDSRHSVVVFRSSGCPS